MYIDDIKIFAKKFKRTWKPYRNYKILQARYGNGISTEKMCHAFNRKWRIRNNERNRIAQSGKHQNTWRKKKLQIPENIRKYKKPRKTEMEEKVKKKYFGRTRKLFEIKRWSIDIKRMNTWDVPPEPSSKWTREEPRRIDKKIRKLSTMYKALPPRDDIKIFCASREGEGWLASTQNCINATI